MATNSFRSRTRRTSRAKRTRRCSSRSTPTCSADRRGRLRRDRLHMFRARFRRQGRAHRRTREFRRQSRRGRTESRGGGRRRHPVRSQAARNARLAHMFSRGVIGQLQGATGSTTIPSARPASSCSRRRISLPCSSNSGISPMRRTSQAMRSADWRVKTAGAMANAVDRFFLLAKRCARRQSGGRRSGVG